MEYFDWIYTHLFNITQTRQVNLSICSLYIMKWRGQFAFQTKWQIEHKLQWALCAALDLLSPRLTLLWSIAAQLPWQYKLAILSYVQFVDGTQHFRFFNFFFGMVHDVTLCSFLTADPHCYMVPWHCSDGPLFPNFNSPKNVRSTWLILGPSRHDPPYFASGWLTLIVLP